MPPLRSSNSSCAKSCRDGLVKPVLPAGHVKLAEVTELRSQVLRLGPKVSSGERGAILALLGSVERAELLIKRIYDERKSVNRAAVVARAAAAKDKPAKRRDFGGEISPVPAE